jgi:catechol 2,3-dioxygenase-like lactoylglutathione lyase family enzyme
MSGPRSISRCFYRSRDHSGKAGTAIPAAAGDPIADVRAAAVVFAGIAPPVAHGQTYAAGMAVKRIKPNIRSDRFDESRTFYTRVIGLEEANGLDWILFFGGDRREVQLSVMSLDIKARVHPDISIEVDDVDAVYERAVAAGAEVVYPLTDEEWGLRRFFVRDPNGAIINVTQHQ